MTLRSGYHTFSRECLGAALACAGQTSTESTTAFAFVTYYVPLILNDEITVTRMFCCNGTAVSNNLVMGLYDYDLNRLATTATVAQTGAGALQFVALPSTTIGPGRYYMAHQAGNNNAARYLGALMASTVGYTMRSAGLLRQVPGAQGLPDSAVPTTLVGIATGIVPIFGVDAGGVL